MYNIYLAFFPVFNEIFTFFPSLFSFFFTAPSFFIPHPPPPRILHNSYPLYTINLFPCRLQNKTIFTLQRNPRSWNNNLRISVHEIALQTLAHQVDFSFRFDIHVSFGQILETITAENAILFVSNYRINILAFECLVQYIRGQLSLPKYLSYMSVVM